MFFEELQITQADVEKLIATDMPRFYEYMQLYCTRRFYIGDTGINRKTLKDWEAAGLLPYPYKEEGWRKFSFSEWAWLECINEFRMLGVSIEKINTIKSYLFDLEPEEMVSAFQNSLNAYDGPIDQKDIIVSAYADPDFTDEIRRQAIEELQLSLFQLVIMTVVLTGQNLCIVYNNSEYCSIFVMGNTNDSVRLKNQEVFHNLINDSFLVVNLRKVVNKLFQKTELRQNESFIIDFLSPKEKKIFDHIRSSNAKEIIITFGKNNEPTHIKVNRNQISKETLNKVARYLKKGSYQSIQFTTRNGELVKYEEQDSIRLE